MAFKPCRVTSLIGLFTGSKEAMAGLDMWNVPGEGPSLELAIVNPS